MTYLQRIKKQEKMQVCIYCWEAFSLTWLENTQDTDEIDAGIAQKGEGGREKNSETYFWLILHSMCAFFV